MTKNNGIHHLAIATADIKTQIEFFNDVLGCELVALYWMHGVEGAWHGFLNVSDTCSIAFVQTADIAGIERTLGVTHAGSAANPVAGGAMQHLSLNVDSYEDLLAMRDRIRSKGVQVVGPWDHGFVQSFYFAGPEGLSLEICCGSNINAEAWVDPEVRDLCGISAEEMAALKAPADHEGEGGATPNPEFDPAQPHMHYPPGAVQKLMGDLQVRC